MLFIFLLIFILNTIRFLFGSRDRNNKIERPSSIQRIALGIQAALAILIALMVLIGIIMKDSEMIIASSVMFLIFATIVFGTRRKFKKFYEEYEEYFFLDQQYVVDRIYYENITDWIPLRKRIGVLDPTQPKDVYIVVNFAFHDPEILLKHLAEMTFSGKFKQTDGSQSNDPYREQEFINHLQKNGYGHIVESFSEKE
jgi:hypothetical protein